MVQDQILLTCSYSSNGGQDLRLRDKSGHQEIFGQLVDPVIPSVLHSYIELVFGSNLTGN
jgi:hypothetical protein